MKRILIDNAWNIWMIAAQNGQEADEGMNFFQSNLEYHGRPDVQVFDGSVDADYDKLAPIWQSMTAEERYVATGVCNRAFNDLDDQLLKLFKAGDRDGFEALLATYDWEPDGPVEVIK